MDTIGKIGCTVLGIGALLIVGIALATANRNFNKEIVQQVTVGNLVTATVIPTSFNESMKMQIVTDKGVYIVRGLSSFNKGEEIYLTYWSNGDIWLSQWRGKGHLFLIQ